MKGEEIWELKLGKANWSQNVIYHTAQLTTLYLILTTPLNLIPLDQGSPTCGPKSSTGQWIINTGLREWSACARTHSSTSMITVAATYGPIHASIITGAPHSLRPHSCEPRPGPIHMNLVAGTYAPTRTSIAANIVDDHTCGSIHKCLPIPQNNPLFPPSPWSGPPTWKG